MMKIQRTISYRKGAKEHKVFCAKNSMRVQGQAPGLNTTTHPPSLLRSYGGQAITTNSILRVWMCSRRTGTMMKVQRTIRAAANLGRAQFFTAETQSTQRIQFFVGLYVRAPSGATPQKRSIASNTAENAKNKKYFLPQRHDGHNEFNYGSLCASAFRRDTAKTQPRTEHR